MFNQFENENNEYHCFWEFTLSAPFFNNGAVINKTKILNKGRKLIQ